MFRKAIAAAALLLAFAALDPAAAQRARTGVLSCDVSAGFGFIIGSQRSDDSARSRRMAVSRRSIPGRFHGLVSTSASPPARYMVWAVFAEYVGPRPGVLAGDYVGATGEATIAVGLGANVLVGGSNRQVALQTAVGQRTSRARSCGRHRRSSPRPAAEHKSLSPCSGRPLGGRLLCVRDPFANAVQYRFHHRRTYEFRAAARLLPIPLSVVKR